jgi:hypothetical protein
VSTSMSRALAGALRSADNKATPITNFMGPSLGLCTSAGVYAHWSEVDWIGFTATAVTNTGRLRRHAREHSDGERRSMQPLKSRRAAEKGEERQIGADASQR